MSLKSPQNPTWFPLERVRALRVELENHPVYARVRDMESLRAFMAQHVFSVWDFMSLLKELQHYLAPSRSPWTPVNLLPDHARYCRFINDIVIEEECDQGLPGVDGEITYASHYELYLQGMKEVGADTSGAEVFVDRVRREGIRDVLPVADLPEPARAFMHQTFAFIDSRRPHVIAAAFALGREHIIPPMFRALIARMDIGPGQAPAFHYYLERHIHLDGDHHGPLSLALLEQLCGDEPDRIEEAEAAALTAIQARIEFWDGVMAVL
jgi:hypothetical protein